MFRKLKSVVAFLKTIVSFVLTGSFFKYIANVREHPLPQVKEIKYTLVQPSRPRLLEKWITLSIG